MLVRPAASQSSSAPRERTRRVGTVCLNAAGRSRSPPRMSEPRPVAGCETPSRALSTIARQVMIATVSPAPSCTEDTHNTLKYAHRAKEIKVAAQSRSVTVEYHVSRYQSIIQTLQQEVQHWKAQAQLKQRPSEALPAAGESQTTEEGAELFTAIDTLFSRRANASQQLWQLGKAERQLGKAERTAGVPQPAAAHGTSAGSDPSGQTTPGAGDGTVKEAGDEQAALRQQRQDAVKAQLESTLVACDSDETALLSRIGTIRSDERRAVLLQEVRCRQLQLDNATLQWRLAELSEAVTTVGATGAHGDPASVPVRAAAASSAGNAAISSLTTAAASRTPSSPADGAPGIGSKAKEVASPGAQLAGGWRAQGRGSSSLSVGWLFAASENGDVDPPRASGSSSAAAGTETRNDPAKKSVADATATGDRVEHVSAQAPAEAGRGAPETAEPPSRSTDAVVNATPSRLAAPAASAHTKQPARASTAHTEQPARASTAHTEQPAPASTAHTEQPAPAAVEAASSEEPATRASVGRAAQVAATGFEAPPATDPPTNTATHVTVPPATGLTSPVRPHAPSGPAIDGHDPAGLVTPAGGQRWGARARSALAEMMTGLKKGAAESKTDKGGGSSFSDARRAAEARAALADAQAEAKRAEARRASMAAASGAPIDLLSLETPAAARPVARLAATAGTAPPAIDASTSDLSAAAAAATARARAVTTGAALSSAAAQTPCDGTAGRHGAQSARQSLPSAMGGAASGQQPPASARSARGELSSASSAANPNRSRTALPVSIKSVSVTLVPDRPSTARDGKGARDPKEPKENKPPGAPRAAWVRSLRDACKTSSAAAATASSNPGASQI